MTAGNLAVCFAPSVFWAEQPSLEQVAGAGVGRAGKRSSRSARAPSRKGAAGDRGTLDFHANQMLPTALPTRSPRQHAHHHNASNAPAPALAPASAPGAAQLSFGLALGVGGGLSAADLRVILKQKAANECLSECVIAHRALFAVRPDAVTSELAPHSALVSAGISRLLRAGLSLGNSSAATGTPNVSELASTLRATRSDEDADRPGTQRPTAGIGALISSSKSYANFISSSANSFTLHLIHKYNVLIHSYSMYSLQNSRIVHNYE